MKALKYGCIPNHYFDYEVPIFQGIKSKDVFKLFIDCHEHLHNMGISEKYGVEFVSFQLQTEAK